MPGTRRWPGTCRVTPAPGDLQGPPAPAPGQGCGEQLQGQGELLHGHDGREDQEEEAQQPAESVVHTLPE